MQRSERACSKPARAVGSEAAGSTSRHNVELHHAGLRAASSLDRLFFSRFWTLDMQNKPKNESHKKEGIPSARRGVNSPLPRNRKSKAAGTSSPAAAGRTRARQPVATGCAGGPAPERTGWFQPHRNLLADAPSKRSGEQLPVDETSCIFRIGWNTLFQAKVSRTRRVTSLT